MKVCLVGNGRDPKWHWTRGPNQSELIDSCDVVIRQNWCPFYYTGFSGWKTDVLVIRSASDIGYGKQMADVYDYTLPDAVVRQVKRVVVISYTPEDTIEAGVWPYLVRYGWSAEQVELVPYGYSDLVRQACKADPKYLLVTLGTIALFWALEQYPEAEILLSGYCFAILGGQRTQINHDFVAEYLWIAGLEKEGRVRFVE